VTYRSIARVHGVASHPRTGLPAVDDDGVESRLTVELVPSTCWYTNARSNVSKSVWGRLRRRR
jgi:hypothetical protein